MGNAIREIHDKKQIAEHPIIKMMRSLQEGKTK
jgi:hypothetical protein